MATEVQIGWLAGIIDGEGCICGHWTNRGKYSTGGSVSVEVRVDATSLAMIMKIASICTDLGVAFALEGPRMAKLSKRPAHRISVRRRADVVRLLSILREHLVVKQQEADATIEFYVAFGEQRGNHNRKASLGDKVLIFEKLRDLKKTA